MKGILIPALWGLTMAALILDSRTAMAGAAEGAMLCMQSMIPGLFPLMVLSSLLASSLPRGALVAAGLLGGYPVGARNAAQAYREGTLDRDSAERMAVASCCAGPSFLFGVARDLRPALLWMIYLISAALLWLLLSPSPGICAPGKPLTVTDALPGSVAAMGQICGWVILMRAMLAVLDRWVLWMLPDWGRIAVWGSLEMTNGILALGDLDPGLGFVLGAGMVGFGGICVMMQARAVARGLSLRLYVPGKVFQGCVCLLLAALLTRTPLPAPVWIPVAAVGTGCALILRKNKKRCGNPTAVGV